MRLHEIADILSQITYKAGWSINLGDEGMRGRPYIQLAVDERSDLTLDPTGKSDQRVPWKSGKRYLSFHMCRQEIVGAALGLIKDAEMHEIHEWFRYKGAAIYNPHLDPDVLAVVASKASSFDVRKNAMSMKEDTP